MREDSTKADPSLPATGWQSCFLQEPCSCGHCGQSANSSVAPLHLNTSSWDVVLAGHEARGLEPALIRVQTCPKFQWTCLQSAFSNRSLLTHWVTGLSSSLDSACLIVGLAWGFPDSLNVCFLFTQIYQEVAAYGRTILFFIFSGNDEMGRGEINLQEAFSKKTRLSVQVKVGGD